MIVVAGKTYVGVSDRDAYLGGCRAVIEAVRRAPGGIDSHLSTTQST